MVSAMDAVFPALQGVAVLLFVAIVAVAILVAVKLRRLSARTRVDREQELDERVHDALARDGFTEDEIRQAQRDARD